MIIILLGEFLADFADVKRRCGRVCGHQLEFDMGVIKREMEHAGLDDELVSWSKAATNGFCTMNPDITGWAENDRGVAYVRRAHGLQTESGSLFGDGDCYGERLRRRSC